jgi:hypothetical protein
VSLNINVSSRHTVEVDDVLATASGERVFTGVDGRGEIGAGMLVVISSMLIVSLPSVFVCFLDFFRS